MGADYLLTTRQIKFSNAIILNGTVIEGAICRMFSLGGTSMVQNITEEKKPSNTKVLQSGGIALPFD